eukprot:2364335-Karenia_brevis.AAC.1
MEFQARLAAGWAKFNYLRPLLCKRDACRKRRLRLFDATVSKTVLWCSESWALTVKQRKELKTTRRAMLRILVGRRRRADEDY